MSDVPEIHALTVQLSKPGRSYQHGRVAQGYWMIDANDWVWLCTENGVRRLDHKRKCPPDVDPKIIACLLLRQSAGKGDLDFNRPLRYPKQVY